MTKTTKQGIQSTLTTGSLINKTHTPFLTKQHHLVAKAHTTFTEPNQKITPPKSSIPKSQYSTKNSESIQKLLQISSPNPKISLKFRNFPLYSNGLSKKITPKIISKISQNEERTRIFHLPMEKWASYGMGTGQIAGKHPW
jgi:hypothetical protein